MNDKNLRRSLFLLERGIRRLSGRFGGSGQTRGSREPDSSVLNGNLPDESSVTAGSDRPDGTDNRFGQLIRAAADRSADSILDSLSARRRREATPLERFRQRYANGF